MKKRNIYILIVVVIILIFIYFFIPKLPKSPECEIDSDCVPSSCCHPNSCVSLEKKPNCSDVLCSMECVGPLDCGAGSCGCVKNKCIIIPNEN